MGKKISMDHPVFGVLGRVTDLIILNLLFLLTCIPVITIGAAQSALYAVTLKMVRGEESYIIRSYLKAFRENFRQATIIWAVALSMIFVMRQNIRMLDAQSPVKRNLLILCIFGVIILTYAFPLLARFENTVWRTVNNALLMAIRHLIWTVAILLVTFLPAALTIAGNQVVTFAIPYWSLIGCAFTALINSWFLRKIFANYEI